MKVKNTERSLRKYVTRPRLSTLAILLLVALLLALGQPWLRLLALAGTVAWAAWPRRRRLGALLARHRADLPCGACLLAVTFVMLLPASVGDRLVSYDHTIHYSKAWQLWQHLSQGRLWGWTDHWMGGYPVGYNYPLGGAIWVNLVRVALLGFCDLSQAYGVAIFLFYFLLALSIYLLGARLLTRGVGLIAALLLVTDEGARAIGGWCWVVKWGVWPCALSVALSLLALSRFERLRRPGPDADRAMVSLALLLAAAVLTHPLQLVHLGVMVPMCMGLFLLSAPLRAALGACLRLGGAAATGIMLASWWLVPFISVGQEQVRENILWQSWQMMGQNLSQGRVIPQLWIWVTALGALGCLALMVTNRFRSLLVGLPPLLLLVLGASTFYENVSLRISEAFTFIAYPRFAMLVQPYLCLGAAYVIHAALAHRAGSVAGPHRRRLLRLTLALCLTLPLALPAGRAFVRERILRMNDTASRRPDWPSRAALVAWLKRRRREDRRFYRYALDRSLGDLHRLADMVTVVDLPMYKVGHTPAIEFRNRTELLNDATLRALSIRYVVSAHPSPVLPTLRQVAAVGAWYVFEHSEWSPNIFHAARNTSSVRVVRHTDNEVVLRADAGVGRLRLNVASFSRWRAYRDGQPIPLHSVRPAGVELQLMAVDASTPGTYTFRFEVSAAEYVGAGVSASGLLLLVGFVVWRRRRARVR